MKKLLYVLLALAMLFSLASCSNTEQNAASPEPSVPAASTNPNNPNSPPAASVSPAPPVVMEDPDPVTVVLWANGAPPSAEAVARVNEKINEITIPAINVEVDLQIWDVGSYIGTVATAVGAGDDIDLMCTFPAAAPHFSSMSAQGMLLPLNDLLEEYGQDILKLIPEDWWGASTRNGKVLGVPLFANKAYNYSIMFVKEWLDETGYKPEDVKTMDDIYNVLKAFQANHPDKIPLSGDNLTLDFTYPGYDFIMNSYYDTLGDATAIAAVVPFTADGKTNYKVVSRYETAGFQEMRKTLQNWYNEGLIDKDTITYNGNGVALTVNPNVFACINVAVPVTQGIVRKSSLNEAIHVDLMDGVLTTAGLIQMTWALPVSCDVPEAAMKLMNMMYTDARLVNLIDFGIEGVHYVLNANGQMEFLPGIDANTSEYYPNCYNFVTNTLLANTWAGTDPDVAQKDLIAIQNSITSPLLGFSFDTGKVSDIYALLGPLGHDEYGPAIFTGAAKDSYYEEFISKLYAAGLQTFIDELQSQVDAWVAANR